MSSRPIVIKFGGSSMCVKGYILVLLVLLQVFLVGMSCYFCSSLFSCLANLLLIRSYFCHIQLVVPSGRRQTCYTFAIVYIQFSLYLCREY